MTYALIGLGLLVLLVLGLVFQALFQEPDGPINIEPPRPKEIRTLRKPD